MGPKNRNCTLFEKNAESADVSLVIRLQQVTLSAYIFVNAAKISKMK